MAADYARQSDLQPPETTILQLMTPLLPQLRMLDLGVGGGRTTVHFAPHVRSYVGADYAPHMIEECRRRFANSPDTMSFAVADAREMGQYPDNSFDFVLFSFNGLDYVTHAERLRALAEIRRVGRPGGWFAFSSHNLTDGARLFEWRHIVSANPRRAKQTIKRLLLRLWFNRGITAAAVHDAPYAVLNDGAHGRKLHTYYIRPAAQLAQLAAAFTDVRVFGLATGTEITEAAELSRTTDGWLYYLCRMR